MRKFLPGGGRLLLAAGLLLVGGALGAAVNPPQTNFPNRIYGEIKSVDPKAGTLVVQPRPGLDTPPPREKPGSTQRLSPPAENEARPPAPKVPDNLTIATSPETIIYTQIPGGLEDCKVGQWARVTSTLTLRNEAMATVITLLPAPPPAEPSAPPGKPQPTAAPPPPSEPVPQVSDKDRPSSRVRGQTKKDVGLISSLKPFVLKLKDGKLVTLEIGPLTRFVTSPRRTLADLKPGNRVVISGESKEGQIKAKEILVISESPRPEGGAPGAGGGPAGGPPK